MITDAQIEFLKTRGYTVEDMSTYGPDWGEQWRFMCTDDFGVPMDSESEAWSDAWQCYLKNLDYEFDLAYQHLMHGLIYFSRKEGEIFVTDDFGHMAVLQDGQLYSILHFINQKDVALQ